MFAVCSAHPIVLKTAMALASEADETLLIEATANQVNQYGGYTGTTPRGFSEQMRQWALETGLPERRLIIGADHLGPHIWRRDTTADAMANAAELVKACVAAGFQKIHLDTGNPAWDGPAAAAERAAALCLVAEKAASTAPAPIPPFYVIGTDVPPPGGGLTDNEPPHLSDPDLLMQTLDGYRQAFIKRGLESAWERVVAVVVQPGVEFGDKRVAHYQSAPAAGLSAAHAELPGIMTYEVHATDYQAPWALRQMVDDHFPLLKVGPGLTFAMQQTLYALADIEAALPGLASPSQLRTIMERLMRTRPTHWQSHYRGDDSELAYLRHHSLRDRIRYYWSYAEAGQAVRRLIDNLKRPIPMPLIEQHLPDLAAEIGERGLHADPNAMVSLGIRKVLEGYAAACWRRGEGTGGGTEAV